MGLKIVSKRDWKLFLNTIEILFCVFFPIESVCSDYYTEDLFGRKRDYQSALEKHASLQKN